VLDSLFSGVDTVGLRVVTIKIPEEQVIVLDALVRRGLFKSRSDAIRIAIKKLLEDIVL
jgi:Arc/MetJ-type ribon-helix-helix transcriptional regulator